MTVATTICGDTISLRFERFGLPEYRRFLQTKTVPEARVSFDRSATAYTVECPTRFAHLLGIEPVRTEHGRLPLAPHLFDYQAFIVETALRARRYAIWADTGLGKTPMQLEFARQVLAMTQGRFLIVAPLNIIAQTIEESAKFYGDALPIRQLHTVAEVADFARNGSGLAITNYEKFNDDIDECRWLDGVALDESSMLKAGGGVQKWSVIRSFKGVPFKLSCTATPAPNDVMEYASQCSFLERLRSDGQILWTYFRRDKNGEWAIKPHAREAFYRFMAGWSVYLRHPAHYGFADNLKNLPDPQIIVEQVEATPEQVAASVAERIARTGDMFELENLGVTARLKLSQIAKGFVYGEGKKASRVPSIKPMRVAEFVRGEVAAGRQVLVWTSFDEEAGILSEILSDVPGIVALTGKTKQSARGPIIESFRRGETRVLLTRAKMLGKGRNFQFCRSMVFSGFDDSFEAFYQAVRRCYRYGQTESVRVFIPYIAELEGMVWNNVMRKQRAWESDTKTMEGYYTEAMQELGFLERPAA